MSDLSHLKKSEKEGDKRSSSSEINTSIVYREMNFDNHAEDNTSVQSRDTQEIRGMLQNRSNLLLMTRLYNSLDNKKKVAPVSENTIFGSKIANDDKGDKNIADLLEVSLDFKNKTDDELYPKFKGFRTTSDHGNAGKGEDEGEENEEGEGEGEEVEEEYDEEAQTNDFIRSKKIMRDVFPTLLFSLIQLVQEMIVLQFIGHYGTSTEFAAVALGSLWQSITGYVMIYGFTSALATLSGHESGKGNQKEVGIQLHQCVFFSLIIALFACLLNFFVEEVLILTDQPPEVAAIVPEYTWPLAISLFPFALIASFVNYLDAQQIFDPPSYSTLLSFVFHPFFCWLFIGVFDWGPFGGGLSICLMSFLDIAFLFGIVRFRDVYWREVKESLFWPSRESFKGALTVLKVGLAAMLLTCVEWWGVEYTTMYAGWCGEDKLSAHAICVQIVNIICMIASSFGLIIQTYSASALGEKNRREFLAICRLGPFLGVLVTGIFMTLIVILRDQVAKMFTSDENIVTMTSTLILPSMVYAFFYTSQCLFGSILKGIGKFTVAIVASIIPYYFMGIPLSYYFAFVFKDFDVAGIWIGIAIGLMTINIVYVAVLLRTNLKEEMEKFEQEAIEEEPLENRNESFHSDHVDIVEQFIEKKQQNRKNTDGFAAFLSRAHARSEYRQKKLRRMAV